MNWRLPQKHSDYRSHRGGQITVLWLIKPVGRGARSYTSAHPVCCTNLALGRADGSYCKILESLAKAHLLVWDDWGLAPLSSEQKHDILELLEDRHGVGSAIITSQLPVSSWHEYIQDPALADAILDRLVHNAYRIELKGESMRKRLAAKSEDRS